MDKIKTNCQTCGKEFEKLKKEFTRSQKIGRLNFCSRSCAGTHNMRIQIKKGTLIPDINNIPIEKRFNGGWNRGGDEFSKFRKILHRIRTRLQDALIYCKNPKEKEFLLTPQDLKEVWEFQGGICPYTGWNLILSVGRQRRNIQNASLDRIDSSKGYTKDNVQFVSVMANYAKNDFSHEDMIRFCLAIRDKWK